ncbi:hypothetical protein BEP19_16665 [Ammoniphilus oxalaticus]|uniref:Holin n=1 Tax=Ammoniphilus oxalaticus TaxID=66863 RepID=A0A419SQP1_9BACL|nr:hypothetical protein [Ammoniphilus oxalaticus]RKD26824.1 hypothetical protein BEP19_16665 [Ammoniphilus oxalaticus]
MFENVYVDIATISAVVAAFVSVVGNAFMIPSRFRAVIALFVGVYFVSIPTWLVEKSTLALLIGLTASGVYTQVKKREYESPEPSEEEANNRPVYPAVKGPDDV